jgi:uncharacterized protein
MILRVFNVVLLLYIVLCHCSCVEELDDSDKSAIFTAIKMGDDSAVGCLLEQSQVDVNRVDEYGNTPLMAAAVRGEKRCVALLLSNGAELDLQDKLGYKQLRILTIIIQRESLIY